MYNKMISIMTEISVMALMMSFCYIKTNHVTSLAGDVTDDVTVANDDITDDVTIVDVNAIWGIARVPHERSPKL